jgi:protein SCO1/2
VLPPLLFRLFCGLALVAALAACDAGKQSFNSVDITGAEFARSFSLTDHTGARRTL